MTEEGEFDVVRAHRRRVVLSGLVDRYRAELFGAWAAGGRELTRERVQALRSSTDSALRELRDISRTWKAYEGPTLPDAPFESAATCVGESAR
jgi:hypothetical protein